MTKPKKRKPSERDWLALLTAARTCSESRTQPQVRLSRWAIQQVLMRFDGVDTGIVGV